MRMQTGSKTNYYIEQKIYLNQVCTISIFLFFHLSCVGLHIKKRNLAINEKKCLSVYLSIISYIKANYIIHSNIH